MNEKQSEATPPGRRGNLTGSARKLKDDAADWHNLILKWERLSDEGSAIATKIVNHRITEKSVREMMDVVVDDGGSSESPSEKTSQQNQNQNQELEEACIHLQNITDKLTRILLKMEKMVSAERGIYNLEVYQFGSQGRPAPLFHSWTTQQFAEASSQLLESYRSELGLKRNILQELAHTTDTHLSMVYLSCWLYQPYIQDSTKLLLESFLMETGHRAL